MIRNYIKIAWRNLIRIKAFSMINIMGLALGMASSLLIFLWIQDELSVDAYHDNGPNLYNVMERQIYDGKVEASPGTPGLLADELKKEFPEVKYAAGFTWEDQHTFAVKDKITKEKGRFAGKDWFSMYTVPLLEGTAATALDGPNDLAISRRMAENLFGSPDQAIGKSVRLNNKADYQVSAVFENIPDNSSEKYEYLLSWQDFLTRNEWAKDWGNNAPRTRLLLHEGADARQLEAKMEPFLKAYNTSLGKGAFDIQLFLQPFQEAYLYSNFENGYQEGGRIEYVRLFSIVALFVLLIACINFMNLATARSVKRGREVGVRKVVGAAKGTLIGQFMGEALLLTILSLVVAQGLVALLLPVFNNLTEKNISLQILQSNFWLMLLVITLVTGLIAGSYPALFLSSLHPLRVLKGSVQFGSGARQFRQGLVVFQFVLSMLLIVGTLIVYRQMDYIQTKNLGYDRENLITLPAEGGLAEKYGTFKQTLLDKPGIQSMTYMDGTPTERYGSTGNVQWPGKDPGINIEFQFSTVDFDFAKTLKIKLKGRDFSIEFGQDSTNFLINETAARRIGYEDPIGKPLTMWGKSGTIVGLIEDFHTGSLHQSIEPFVARLSPDASRKNIVVRTEPGQTKQALESLEATFRQFNPAFPFSYQFVDQSYQKLYRSETVLGSLSNYFAFLAIFISCLGLLGLSAFMAEQRTKEIGVRKVLGASIASVMVLLSQDFLKLILIAILIACPIGWYVMGEWLQKFEYKVEVEWWVFVLAGVLACVIALLTISVQSMRAAMMNPVKSLRSE